MSTVEKIQRTVSELESRRFYGSLELKFDAGRVAYVRKTETLNFRDDHREPRGEYERRDNR
jgi:hypothetical protein